MSALCLRIIKFGVTVIVRCDRTKNHPNAGIDSHFSHRGNVRHDGFLGNAVGKIIGSGHNHHDYRVESDHILLEAGKHVLGLLTTDTLVYISVSAEETGMEFDGDIISIHSHV